MGQVSAVKFLISEFRAIRPEEIIRRLVIRQAAQMKSRVDVGHTTSDSGNKRAWVILNL